MDESYAAPVKKPAPDQTVDSENAENETAVVSNKILSPYGEPLKEGDEIVVRVVKNYGDECEIEYAPHKEGEEEEEPAPTEDSMNEQTSKEIGALDTGEE